MKKGDSTFRHFLEDMLDSIQAIEQFIQGIDLDTFLMDRMRKDAVVRNLEIIGEAANEIPDAIKTAHPAVPWEKMYRMRNIVSHHYFGIDYVIVWKIIKEYLPQDKEALIQIIQYFDNEYNETDT